MSSSSVSKVGSSAIPHPPSQHHRSYRGGTRLAGSSTGAGSGHNRRHRKTKHSVHWFRKGLRLSDNPALLRAIRKCDSWRCVFILDPWFAGSSNQGVNKWRFLLQCLEDLDQSLRKLDSRLFVIRGQPADVLPDLFREWGTTYFTFEEDPEPFGKVRDKNIVAMCKELGISVVQESSHTLYNLDKIIELSDGKPPLTYRQFIKVAANLKPPPTPAPAVCSRLIGHGVTPMTDDHDERWGVPTLSELGFDVDGLIGPPVWIGGETEALSRLERHLERKAWVASFGRPKMTPQSLLPSQTGLSPYLRFGCLSTRLFYHALRDLYKKIKKTEPPLSLYGQLLWREFFYTAATRNPNFDRMYGNPICVQIPWDKNSEALAKWAGGKTGFPWIDAIMTQLRQEGWIHHLSRHAVACFLTRGHLWISWEEGMKVFDELLLDTDWSVNAGTWMWLSCSSFFQQFFHLYCPVKFGRKADPNGDYIRRYVPALKNYPTRYIHEPWTAHEQVQKAAKCIIGVDYPKPMVDHAAAAKINQERMKQVYQQLSSYRNAKLFHEKSISPKYQRTMATSTAAVDELLLPGITAPAPAVQGQQQVSSFAYGRQYDEAYQISSQASMSENQGSAQPFSGDLPDPDKRQKQQLKERQLQEQQKQHARSQQSMETGSIQSFMGSSNNAQGPQEVDFLVPSITIYQSPTVQDTMKQDAIQLEKEKQGAQQHRSRNANLTKGISSSADENNVQTYL